MLIPFRPVVLLPLAAVLKHAYEPRAIPYRAATLAHFHEGAAAVGTGVGCHAALVPAGRCFLDVPYIHTPCSFVIMPSVYISSTQ